MWQMFFIAKAGHRMYKTEKGHWLPERMLEMNRDRIKIWKTERWAVKAQELVCSYGYYKVEIEKI